MANPRELAEQAFAILQNALRDSEARASELDEQLKRKKAPKGKLEEQLDVLQHRLDAVEAERARWQQAASHLEEIAEAERAKVAQLKKKLDIAESGPEKLTKKEINFWRAKAEDIDTETKDYKTRLANLRKELIERDALIDKLNTAQQGGAAAAAEGAVVAGAAPGAAVEIEALQSRLEERERRVVELQAEVEESRTSMEAAAAAAPAGPPPELLAQIESLQRQITTFEQALAESHTARAAFNAELAQARTEIADQQRASREAQADGERVRGTLSEREHKIVELSAEIEHTRAELRQREQQVRDGAQRDEQIGALSRDLEALHNRADNDRRDAAHAQAEREQLREALRSAELRLDNTNGELDGVRRALAQQEQSTHDAAAAIRGLQAAIDERDRQLAERDRRLAERNQRLDERDRQDADRALQLAESEQRLVERDRRLVEADRQLAEIDQQLAERSGQVAERDRRITDLEQELDDRTQENSTHRDRLAERDGQLAERDRQLAEHDGHLAERDNRLAALSAELEQARTAVQATNRELTSLRDTLLGSTREVELLRNHKHGLEQELSDLLTRVDAAADAAAHQEQVLQRSAEQVTMLERQRDEMREQMAGLEAELKEEKDNAENLGQLANERREAMTKLQEQVEDADERYEEAKWRLGKAQYFERLVKRRKGLIGALLAQLRAKMKANVALKAGLDGLRTYKAAAEVNQQKLLQRIDTLKTELKEAEETIDRHQGSTLAKEQLADTQAKALTLETRLNTQAELIVSLESDLKIARASMKSGDEKNHEIERLHKELDAKNQHVERLQADADEQQRKLAKLRGSESETMRLKAISEKDRGSIDQLEREIAQLREALARQTAVPAVTGAASGASNPELEAKLKERETSLTRLMGTIKEHEATIKKLTEASESWKRKYNFLATDSPDAYKTAAEK